MFLINRILNFSRKLRGKISQLKTHTHTHTHVTGQSKCVLRKGAVHSMFSVKKCFANTDIKIKYVTSDPLLGIHPRESKM